jgi:hypothetical protein
MRREMIGGTPRGLPAGVARMQSPDPSIYLRALITIDPAGWDPFG